MVSHGREDNMDTEIITTEKQIEGQQDLTVIESLDSLVKTNAANLTLLNDEIKKYREMLSDAFANNVVYKEADESVKRSQHHRLRVKNNLAQSPDIKVLDEKLKDLRVQKKEKQAAMSDYLLELSRMTGQNQLELFDTEIYDIVKVAKLVKRRGK